MAKILMGAVCVALAITGLTFVISRDMSGANVQIAAPGGGDKCCKDKEGNNGLLKASLGF